MRTRVGNALAAALVTLSITLASPMLAFAAENDEGLAPVDETLGIVEDAPEEEPTNESTKLDSLEAELAGDTSVGGGDEVTSQEELSDGQDIQFDEPAEEAVATSEDSMVVQAGEGDSKVENATTEVLSAEVPEEQTTAEMMPAEDEQEEDVANVEAVEPSQKAPAGDSVALGAQSGGSAAAAAQAELDKLAREHAGDLPAGRYAVWSRANKKDKKDTATYSLDVRGASKSAGAQVILYRAKVASNQRWDIAYLSSGYATIRSAASGLYLALRGGEGAYAGGGAAVVEQQARQEGARWQEWVIVAQPDGSYKIVSALLKNGTLRRTLDVRGGVAEDRAELIVFENRASGDANQRFTVATTADILNDEARGHAGDLKDGTYLVSTSLKSSYRLNMSGASMANGGKAILYAGAKACVNEGWDIVHRGIGYVYIFNSKSGKVLDVRGGSAKDGAAVIQWASKKNARNQLWIAVRESDGTYRFVSALTGGPRYVLTVGGGKAANRAAAEIERDGGAPAKAQRWVLKPAPAQYAYAHSVADGTYVIRTALDGAKALGVGDLSTGEQAQVRLWGAAQTNGQLWTLSHDGQGYVLLRNRHSGKYLAFSRAKVGNATVTVQSATAGRWVVKPAGGGFALVDGATGRAVDLNAGKSASGTMVLANKVTGYKRQSWTFKKATPFKIAIDPGHGADDSGAVGNGLRECDLNWRIAKACADKLKALGYDVYMTMTQSEFKNSSRNTPTIKERVERAYKAGCCAIFSMHINASDGYGAAGAEVLVPNSSSYFKDYYYQGLVFCKDVLARIKSGVGIANRGPLIRNYSVAETGEDAEYYPGGGYADYYGIVRYARRHGMFGVIIEHGFITNSRDASIINNNATKLGQIDAAAIQALYK